MGKKSVQFSQPINYNMSTKKMRRLKRWKKNGGFNLKMNGALLTVLFTSNLAFTLFPITFHSLKAKYVLITNGASARIKTADKSMEISAPAAKKMHCTRLVKSKEITIFWPVKQSSNVEFVKKL